LVEGLPKASETYTVSEFQSLGMIGLYREE